MLPDNVSAAEIISRLGLQPHPEGGHYRETWRDAGDAGDDGARGSGTAIYYLLSAGEVSAWHRVDAVEIWHWYAGAPLSLMLSTDGKTTETITLGPALSEGQQPQGIVPINCWQSARSEGAWTLVGCTVSPAFVFDGFEMAPTGWSPGA